MEHVSDFIITGAIFMGVALTAWMKKKTITMRQKKEDAESIENILPKTISRGEFESFEERIERKLDRLEDKIDKLMISLLSK